MQQRHKNRKQYFEEQSYTTKKYVIPFIEDVKPINDQTSVLEIGCGEGGNLPPFIERCGRVVGVDLNFGQLDRAAEYMADDVASGKLELVYQDIYKVSPEELGAFDIIVMRDVIEHIPNQEKFMKYVQAFLKEDGVFFLGFPPWQMPFGGHQQTLKGFLSKTPWIHLFPNPIYKRLMRFSGASEKGIEDKMFIKETGITIERFRSILKAENYLIHKEVFYFINPNYEAKFGLKPRNQIGIMGKIPYLRNFVTTCSYYLISKSV